MSALTPLQESMLEHIYYDQKNFFGRDKLHDLLKDNPNPPSKLQIMNWLKKQETHQLHLRPKRSSVVKPIALSKPDTLYQLDLIDMGVHKDGSYRYILVLIDAFSKKAYTEPLKEKSAEAVFKAFYKVFNDNLLDFRVLQTDNGTEFKGRLEEFLKQNDIKHITGIPKRPQSQGIVERFNGTLKNLIFKNQTATDTKTWRTVLRQLTANYNNTKHRATQERPDDITSPEIIKNVAITLKNRVHSSPMLNEPDDIKVGDHVRIKLFKGALEKASTQNWSTAVYKVIKIIRSSKPYIRIKYKLAYRGEPQKNNFGRNDIQPTDFTEPEREPTPAPQEPKPRKPRTPKPIPSATRSSARLAAKKKPQSA
jgi:hypothetical protein